MNVVCDIGHTDTMRFNNGVLRAVRKDMLCPTVAYQLLSFTV